MDDAAAAAQLPATLDTLPTLRAPDVRAAITTLRRVLAIGYDRTTDVDDPTTLAALSYELDKAATDLRAWRDTARRRLTGAMRNTGTNRVELGRYVAELAWSKARKNWQSDRVLAKVIETALVDTPTVERVDPDTGEVSEQWDQEVLVRNVATAIFECAPLTASTPWRVRKLRDRGIRPADYCDEADEAEPTLHVTGPES